MRKHKGRWRINPYKRPICPGCGAAADYDRTYDIFVHRDPGLSTRSCVLAIIRGGPRKRSASGEFHDDELFILYRMFNHKLQLLYVGITSNPATRLGQHAQEKQWFPEVAEIRLEHYETRAALLAAEREAIETENPRHNVTYSANPKRGGQGDGTLGCPYPQIPWFEKFS